MRISQDFLQSVRERVPLSAIVGRAVSWDRRKSQPGRGDYWSCCPFHEEKTPSFHVDDRKGYYHCFGCHQSGDHIGFLMDHQGLQFMDAVAALCAEAGVAMPERTQEDTGQARRRRRGRDALDAAAALYTAALWGVQGREALAYARSRGFSDELLKSFGFGYALSPVGALIAKLREEEVADDDIERVGLAVRRDGGSLRERFRGRLMVPIHDGQGRMVGFGGRSLDGREPKYLNSPETPLFDKSSLLYNAHRARGPAHRANRLFVVEGYLDAVALAGAGLAMTVASLGTALTEAQIKLAWQLADEPVLCFDGDRAGRSAAHRALDRIVPLLSAGRSFQFLTLPDGQDPDDVVRAGGAEAFQSLSQRALPLVDALFEREVEKGVGTPERMAALESRLDAIAGSIGEERVGSLYRAAFRERLFALRRTRSSAKAAPSGAPTSTQTALRQPAPSEDALADLERIVLGLMIALPHLIDAYGERLAETRFASEAHQAMAAMLAEAFAETLAQTPQALIAALPPRARMCLSEIWGEADDGDGARLKQRFSILAYEPGEPYLSQCVDVFLRRLQLREQSAELAAATANWFEGGDENEARLLSLTGEVQLQSAAVADAERDLADQATVMRRTKALSDGSNS